MSRIEILKKNYQRICSLPWDRNVAGSQRVWLAVYDKEDERKLRLRLNQTTRLWHSAAQVEKTQAVRSERSRTSGKVEERAASGLSGLRLRSATLRLNGEQFRRLTDMKTAIVI
jgi:hypothetical protein